MFDKITQSHPFLVDMCDKDQILLQTKYRLYFLQNIKVFIIYF